MMRMTEKRFQYNVNKNTIEQDGKFVAYMNSVDGVRIANKLNVFKKENEQLKIRFNEEREKSLKFCRNIDTLTIENEQLKHRLSQQEMEYATTAHRQAEENEELKDSIDNYNTAFKKLQDLTEKKINENEQLKADKQALIDFIRKEFPKSHKHILEGFE